ncbi:MAG: hypothetical protein VXZ47_02415, partial [Candidatus Thermoplasmatota archaeon]|nr:hypothetical protein [Candidatus Thermoplasmatota archaeon]
ANTNKLTSSLGVYYKFNEGETGVLRTDATVLDYSGRISNGEWVGYASGSSLRQTGSALVLSDAAVTEYKDPILYADHPEVSSLYTQLIEDAKYHDDKNNSGIYHSIPEWITTEDQEGGNVLKKLTQVIASYFDELQHITEELPRLKDKSYRYLRSLPSGSGKPLPFSDKLLESSGFISPEIFVDADVLAQFLHRDEEREFSDRLHNIKNAIYQNIYNNLVHIYKSKGTEKAFRNLFRCFGVDDELLKINLYADDVTFEFQDNYKHTAVKKTYIDFNHADRHGSIVYQQTSSTNPNTVSYIDGFTGGQVGTPMTFEAEAIFPYKFTEDSVHYVPYDHLTSSIFGVHTAVDNQADLSWASTDYNFALLAVREEKNSPNVRFAVSSSLANNLIFSNTYYDVYDSHKWNFAVRVKPDELPLGTHGLGTTDQTYTLELYGVRAAADVVQEEFTIGTQISNAMGTGFLKSKKRVFVGSDRVDTTGSQKFYSDVKVSSVAAWTAYLSSSVIQAHAFDPGNMGIDDPYKNAFLMNVEGTPVTDAEFVPRTKTLALHWDFSTVTGSGAANSSGYGDFFVEDLSSGSAGSRYGEFSHILEKQHTGLGDRFLVNQKEVVDTEFLSAAEKRLPEILNSSDMVKILEQDDIQFTRYSRPINMMMMIEKSMYQTVSEDMVNLFASVKDFNNLVGDPVNQYRPNYKDMEKLRTLYFDSIGNEPDLEKYLEYYKWIDSAISKMAEKLIPASANMPDSIKTVVEEYIFGRSKYLHKFPTMEFKTKVPEASLRGIEELDYNWKFGHAPLPSPIPPTVATATITTTGGPFNDETFTLTDAAGLAVTFVIKTGVTTVDGTKDGDNVIIGVNGAVGSAAATGERIRDAINASDLAMTAVEEVGPLRITLTQQDAGAAGNTAIDMSGVTTVTATNFTGGEGRPISESKNSIWWRERSDRDKHNGRDKIQSVATTDVSGSWIPYKLADSNRAIYHGSTYARRALLKPYKLNVTKDKYLHGGHNFHENKRIGISQTAFIDVDATRPVKLILNPFASGSTITTDVFDPSEKLRRDAMVVNSSAGNGKSNHLMPFSLYSSSVDIGDFGGVEGEKIEISNLHHDGYGIQGDVPMQSPFTETHVGGRQHRHVIMGTGSDNARNRPEGFRINFNTTSTEHGISHADVIGAYDKLNPQSPPAPFMRDEYAKRPINVRNIKTGEPEHAQRLGNSAAQLTKVDAQLRIGNYRKKYEILQTSGRTKNNSVFKNRTAVFDDILKTRTNNDVVYNLPSSNIISGTVDFERLQRTGTLSNKHVFVERFSSPGGPATMGDSHGGAGLDIIAGEYSVYNTMNYRNKLVRDGLDRFEKAHSIFGGLELPKSGSTNLLYPSMDRGRQKNKFRTAVGKLNFGIRRNYPGGLGDGGLISHAGFLSGSKFGIYDGSKYASFVIDSGSLTGSNGEFINFTIRDCNPAPFTLIQLGGQVTTGSTGIGQVVNGNSNNGPHQAWIARVVADAIKKTFGENMDVSVEDRTITMRTIMDSSYHDSRPQFHDAIIHEQPGDPGDFQLQHTGDDDPGDGRGFWFTGSHPGRAQKNYGMAGGSDLPFEDSSLDRGLWHYFQIEDALDYPSNPSSAQQRISYHKTHRNTRMLITRIDSTVVSDTFDVFADDGTTSGVIDASGGDLGDKTITINDGSAVRTVTFKQTPSDASDVNISGGQNPTTVATRLAAAINDTSAGTAISVTATSSGNVVTLTGAFIEIGGTATSTVNITHSKGKREEGVVDRRYDNFSVRHMIPANDFQYAWITSSHLPYDPANIGDGKTQIPGGYAAPDGMYSSSVGVYPAISFVSASDFGSVMIDNFVGRGDENSIIRVFGGTHASMAQSSSFHGFGGLLGQRNNNWVPTDFVGLNTNLYEPISSSMNTLGYPKFEVGARHDYMGKSRLLNHFFVSGSSQRVEFNPAGASSGSAKYDVFDNLVTFDQFLTGRNSLGGAVGSHYYETLINATAISPSALINALYLHRNGPYGYPSWKQIRGGEHAVVRYHKKKNIISIMKRPEVKKFSYTVTTQGESGPEKKERLYEVKANRRSEFHNRVEPVVSSRHFPMQTSVETTDGGLIVEHTYGNNLGNYANPVLNTNSSIGDPEQQTYDKLKSLYLGGIGAAENPITAFNYHIYKESVFPRERFAYLAQTRGRENYTESHVSYSHGRPTDHLTFWKDDELERTRVTASGGPGTWSNPNNVPLGGQHEPVAETIFGRTLSVLSASNFPWKDPTSDISPASDSIYGFGGAGITPGQNQFTSSYWLPASVWDLDAAAPYAALVMPTGSRRVTGSHDTAVHTKYGIDLGAQGAADNALARYTPAYGLATSSHAPDWVGEISIFVNDAGLSHNDDFTITAKAGTTGASVTRTITFKTSGDDGDDVDISDTPTVSTIATRIAAAITDTSAGTSLAGRVTTSVDGATVYILPADAGDVLGVTPKESILIESLPTELKANISLGVTGSDARREPIQVVGSRKYPWWVTSSLGKYEALTALNGALASEGRAIQEFYLASEADQLDTGPSGAPSSPKRFGNPWNINKTSFSQMPWSRATSGKAHDSMKRQRLKAGLSYEFLQWVPNWLNVEGIQPFNSQSVSGDLGTREYDHYIPRYRTNELAGRNPWFNSYADYLEDIRRIAKDHTILPEFRMSEHVDYYVNNRLKDPNKAWLQLLGGKLNASSSASDETGECTTAIFQEYSHSDFMKYFGEIQDEHAELVETKPSVLKLSMQGVKKLLPYKGFYPSQRTVQIAQIFSQSFSPGVDNDAAITALNQPLFGPGILFNSIKSGIACDWLTYTASAPRVDEQWSPWYVDGADL